jgi:hypothetical protein
MNDETSAQVGRREGVSLHRSAALIAATDRLTVRPDALFIVVDMDQSHRVGVLR